MQQESFMSDLRARVIRMAYVREDLRPHLLSVLAAEKKMPELGLLDVCGFITDMGIGSGTSDGDIDKLWPAWWGGKVPASWASVSEGDIRKAVKEMAKGRELLLYARVAGEGGPKEKKRGKKANLLAVANIIAYWAADAGRAAERQKEYNDRRDWEARLESDALRKREKEREREVFEKVKAAGVPLGEYDDGVGLYGGDWVRVTRVIRYENDGPEASYAVRMKDADYVLDQDDYLSLMGKNPGKVTFTKKPKEYIKQIREKNKQWVEKKLGGDLEKFLGNAWKYQDWDDDGLRVFEQLAASEYYKKGGPDFADRFRAHIEEGALTDGINGMIRARQELTKWVGGTDATDIAVDAALKEHLHGSWFKRMLTKVFGEKRRSKSLTRDDVYDTNRKRTYQDYVEDKKKRGGGGPALTEKEWKMRYYQD